MPQSNVELVRRGIGSTQEFWAMLDDYVVWDLRAWVLPDLQEVFVGRDAVIAGSRHPWGTWEDYGVEAEELVDAGSSVVVILRERGRGNGSGAPFEQLHPQVWTFRDGRIVRWESHPTREDALRAAGLRE